MDVVERVERRRWSTWLTMAALMVAFLLGRSVGQDIWPAATARSSGNTSVQQLTTGELADPAGREPTFEEEMERLHPTRSPAAMSCSRGSGSGTGCCCGGRRSAGSGSGSGSGVSQGDEGRSQCSVGGGCGGRGQP